MTPDSPVFTGETVNLKCVIESYSNWRYEWYKDSVMLQTSVNRDTLTIRGVNESDQGQYWCRGQRDERPKSSQSSSAVYLSVAGELNIIVLINSLYYMNTPCATFQLNNKNGYLANLFHGINTSQKSWEKAMFPLCGIPSSFYNSLQTSGD